MTSTCQKRMLPAADPIASPALSTISLLRKLAFAGVLLAFAVVVLGAYVRLTAAGLGCPDWPGCYGHVTPFGAEQSVATGASLSGPPLDVDKAWHEMIHRYAAGALVLLIVLIVALTSLSRHSPVRPRYALGLLATVGAQAALGMLTVKWQLTPLIVTLHLLFGLGTLTLMWWLWLTLRNHLEPRHAWRSRATESKDALQSRTERRARMLAGLALVSLLTQISLGGWTSSNYAAVACPDFPTCQGSWWPAMDNREAFVVWRTSTANYEGGLLTGAARVAIHFTHRLGALIATCALLLAAVYVLCCRGLRHMHAAAMVVLVALVLQLTIGISMVLWGFPLWLATAHNAGAALTLLAVITLVYQAQRLTQRSGGAPWRSVMPARAFKPNAHDAMRQAAHRRCCGTSSTNVVGRTCRS